MEISIRSDFFFFFWHPFGNGVHYMCIMCLVSDAFEGIIRNLLTLYHENKLNSDEGFGVDKHKGILYISIELKGSLFYVLVLLVVYIYIFVCMLSFLWYFHNFFSLLGSESIIFFYLFFVSIHPTRHSTWVPLLSIFLIMFHNKTILLLLMQHLLLPLHPLESSQEHWLVMELQLWYFFFLFLLSTT